MKILLAVTTWPDVAETAICLVAFCFVMWLIYRDWPTRRATSEIVMKDTPMTDLFRATALFGLLPPARASYLAGVPFPALQRIHRNVVSNGGELGEQKIHDAPEKGRVALVNQQGESRTGVPERRRGSISRTPGIALTSGDGVNRQKPSHDRHCSDAEAPRPCAYRMTAARNNGSLGAECWKPHGFLSLACAKLNDTASSLREWCRFQPLSFSSM